MKAYTMSDIIFQCGKSFKEIERVFVKNIYSGFLEGSANQKINQELFGQFVKDVQESSLNQTPYLILQKIKSNDQCAALPAYACAVSLLCDEHAIDSSYLMSAATLVWFQASNPLTEGFDLHELVKTLCWKDVAKDVNW